MLPAPTIDKNLFENRNKTNISKHSKHQVCARVLFKFQNDCVNCGRIILFPLSEFLSLHCQFNLLYTAQEISAISNYYIGAVDHTHARARLAPQIWDLARSRVFSQSARRVRAVENWRR